MIRWVLAVFATALANVAAAQTCQNMAYDGNRFSVCEADMANADLRLFLYDPDGRIYGHFPTLSRALEGQGLDMSFAMNAGMYHEDRAPVGHYVENGREIMRVIPNAGPGNFGMLPNGVFCIREGRADVIETTAYLARKPACTYATQSGPMLVIDGELHPRFLEGSDSRYIRNGVGTTADGRMAIFAISHRPVTFHEFGSVFRDALGLDQALYFDGNVSRLHAPALGRTDGGRQMGPVVGVAVPAE